ncbi:hypothetical protein [Streptomyces sp. NBC_00091]|nr:hypothetical protein [Streptomyces sp. NBC_00091]MCX5378677.1 hypothetical protein [Streptomyces sp. NBC_00091]
MIGIDTPDGPVPRAAPVPVPSADLLARARAGWERFVASLEEASDE